LFKEHRAARRAFWTELFFRHQMGSYHRRLVSLSRPFEPQHAAARAGGGIDQHQDGVAAGRLIAQDDRRAGAFNRHQFAEARRQREHALALPTGNRLFRRGYGHACRRLLGSAFRGRADAHDHGHHDDAEDHKDGDTEYDDDRLQEA